MIVFSHTIQIQFQPDCGFSKGIGALLSLNSGAFLYMFSAFYVKTYKKNQRNLNSDTSAVTGQAKKKLLDAPPKAKPQELNKEARSSILGYMEELDDYNNNTIKECEAQTPLYTKLVQNGHLSSHSTDLGIAKKLV